MFERLTDRLQDTFRNLTGRGILTEKNIADAMRDVRRALLEADVNYQVVKKFVRDVTDECLGENVLRSVKPGQQAVKVVSDHLTSLLGEANVPLDLNAQPAVVMLVGLHGSGKTTTAAKLARHLQNKEGKSVMLAACDLHRPAAIEQIEILGAQLNIPVYTDRANRNVDQIAVDARNAAAAQQANVLILDTAGRHQIDEDLVQQLVDVKRRAQPREILLVADAALGQEAVSVAEHFDQALGITGIILTKLDGDARGGAALSMREVTGKPIKFVGVGEKMEDLQPFYPDRMASRILGMGDVVSLVEKAAEHFEEEEAAELEEKLRKNKFDLNDFLKQLRRLRKMGGIMSMLDMLPGMGQLKGKISVDEKQFSQIEGIICSMTPFERENPDKLSTSRRQRVAKGSGVTTSDVSQLLNRFTMMQKMLGNMGQMEDMMVGMQGGLGSGGGPSLGMPGLGGFRNKSTRASNRAKKKRRKRGGR
jgi:signal recognition particle subunit SRP54